MLEFVIVYFPARRIGGIVEAKGQSGTAYKWLTAGLWFGGEILGFIVRGYRPARRCPGGLPLRTGGRHRWGGHRVGPGFPGAGESEPSVESDLPDAADGRPGVGAAEPGATPPSLMIPGNVELVVENRAGDWAQVRAANGFSGFVDARVLIPRSGAVPWMGQP